LLLLSELHKEYAEQASAALVTIPIPAWAVSLSPLQLNLNSTTTHAKKLIF